VRGFGKQSFTKLRKIRSIVGMYQAIPQNGKGCY